MSTITTRAGKGSPLTNTELDSNFTNLNTDKYQSGDSMVASELDLSAISASIADTAVDVFVYDTRKDSDGGAWRKRTQHTSWYNETLNTATRGSRKEFPAVAVIVAEASQVTIYDGDDPDLPMWMVLNERTTVGFIRGTLGFKCISALNGVLVIGSQVLNYVDFLSDSGGWLEQSFAAVWTGLANRDTNNGLDYPSASDSRRIVALVCNDIAMTVLPNAPIDPATGLPIPTIAVATDGGVSVIKDDGSVVDIVITQTLKGAKDIKFVDATRIAFTAQQSGGDSSYWRYVVLDVPESDKSASYWQDYENILGIANVYAFGNYIGTVPALSPQDWTSADIFAIEKDAIGGDICLALHDKAESKSKDMVANITSTYNTGWMNGDIKLATLSDTDATNVTGTELVTNGTFDSDVSGWIDNTIGGSITWDSGNQCLYGQTGTVSNELTSTYVTTEIGKTYTVSFKAVARTGASLAVFNHATGGALFPYTDTVDGNTYTFTFTASQTSVGLRFRMGSANSTLKLDNISVRLAEEDRSVNGKGLQVFGTVTKSAVATGADLVAYSGFSSSNYLQQPYNSDLDFGTGDYSISFWMYRTSDSTQMIFSRTNDDGSKFWVYGFPDQRLIAGSIDASNVLPLNTWLNVVICRSNGVMYGYVNGKLVDSEVSSQDINASTEQNSAYVGIHEGSQYASATAKIALFRISATAPTAEQIKTIYESEKHLFTDGAQATLYGSSDAVTALAYDDTTDLLHVGTSAGRSDFSGLRRVSNTTDAVGVALSASNGLIAEE